MRLGFCQGDGKSVITCIMGRFQDRPSSCAARKSLDHGVPAGRVSKKRLGHRARASSTPSLQATLQICQSQGHPSQLPSFWIWLPGLRSCSETVKTAPLAPYLADGIIMHRRPLTLGRAARLQGPGERGRLVHLSVFLALVSATKPRPHALDAHSAGI